jgi:hypothetical protein
MSIRDAPPVALPSGSSPPRREREHLPKAEAHGKFRVKLIILAFLGIAPAVLLGLWVGHRHADRPPGDPGVEGNARLIGVVSVLLLIPLAAEVVTGIRPGLLAHALIGFLLVPLVVLKLGSVGYRFVRFYTSDPRYRAAGAPDPVLRLIGPALVLATLALFATGIELWLFGFRFGAQWLTWHKVAFVLWFLVMTVHVLAYSRRAPELAVADSRVRLRGALARRSLVVASLLLGGALVIAMLPFPSPFAPLPGAG